ncbi:YfgM family protein, partial [Franconibacter helveticus]|uniref:YfgM family protein n=1 Tax=Franconibacter helveticus TaxID=357240 RepID=UPI000463A9CE
MEIYENENDQVDAVKRFFAENGKALAVGVVLGIGALVGWRYWTSHEVDSARSASLAYDNAVSGVRAVVIFVLRCKLLYSSNRLRIIGAHARDSIVISQRRAAR